MTSESEKEMAYYPFYKRKKKAQTPEEIAPIAPSPQPIPGRGEEEAKKKVRKRAKRGGRESTILAGKMMSKRGADILNVRLG